MSIGNPENYLVAVLLFTITGFLVIMVGSSIQYTALNNVYNNPNNIVSCDKNSLPHFQDGRSSIKNGYISIITGYCAIVISIFFLFLLNFSVCGDVGRPHAQDNNGNPDHVGIINCFLPAIVTLAAVGYKLYIIIRYLGNLSSSRVASEYFHYSSLSFFLILCLVCFLFKQSYDTHVANNHDGQGTQYVSIMYVLGVSSIIIIGITNVILSYFSTDG